jgi:phosphatidylinositol alpha-1,6-mannosyltransferase
MERLNIKDRITIFDQLSQEELRLCYQKAELFWLMSEPSNHDVEGFGLVFLEAAAAGIPVIGTLDSGAADAILDGENGLLVDPRQTHRVAEKIYGLLSNRPLWQKMSQKSLRWAESMDWEKQVQRYAELYQSLV